MGDIVGVLRSSVTRVVGADLTEGGETYPVGASEYGDLQAVDRANTQAVFGVLSVGTTPVELRVGATALIERKMVHFLPRGNGIHWGYSNAVTTSNGTPVFKNQFMPIPVGPNISVWLVGTAGTVSVAIGELA